MNHALPDSGMKTRAAIGFIYVVDSITKDYKQSDFWNVPTFWGERLYFGPCKRVMRPKMQVGDYVFGLSRQKVGPRRIIFGALIEERISFAEAYRRLPELRGPKGPIHVEPNDSSGKPSSLRYAHIRGSIHADDWERDLKGEGMDAFFICQSRRGWLGDWLGQKGPILDDELLQFFKKCMVYAHRLRQGHQNSDASIKRPIALGGRSRGLHLETMEPERLIELCDRKLALSRI